MSFEIFRLDWILIDTVIIILLILLLISVKIFKEMSRWRYSISNEKVKRFPLKNCKVDLTNPNLVLKKYEVIKSIFENREESSKTVIIMIDINVKRKLLRNLIEGLTSYGIVIIILGIKYKFNIKGDILERTLGEDIRKVISAVLYQSKQEKFISSSHYMLMNYSESRLFYRSLFTDENHFGTISINPKINKTVKSKSIDISDPRFKVYYIFSKKSYFGFTNNNLKRFLREFPHYNKGDIQLSIIENSRKSFKYYETILLGIIISIIESTNLKKQS